MAGIERDQLELLKRQIEEEYRLDMAAIERLQRRCGPSASGNLASRLAAAPIMTETATSSPLPALDPLAPSQQDDITGSLRAMFSSISK